MAEQLAHDSVTHSVGTLPLVLADARLVQRNRAEANGRVLLVDEEVHDLDVL